MPPVVTGIERIAQTDAQFSDGTRVQKGTMVMACHLVNHFNPDFHHDPLVFNPTRWLDEESESVRAVKMYPGSFIPFSIGERRCPGQKFAMMEAAIVLGRFLDKFDYRIVD
jgi:cytochrome P450